MKTKFNFHILTIDGLFRDNDLYKVPKFQRDYSWEKEQVEEFILDLIISQEKYEQKKDLTNYYFGSIFLITDVEDPSIYNIIDGQQRLTTGLVFYVVLRDYFIDKDNDLVELLEEYIYRKDPFGPRIELNRNNNDYFKNSILNKKNIDVKIIEIEKEKSTSKNRELKNCYLNIAKIILNKYDDKNDVFSKIPVDHNDKTKMLKKLSNYFLNRFELLVYSFTNKTQAYRLFESINHKGLPLAQNDLVKNYLLEKIDETGDEHDKDLVWADNTWSNITNSLTERKIKEDSFLKWHLLSTGEKEIANHDIYDVIVEKIRDKKNSMDFLSKLKEDYDYVERIYEPTSINWGADYRTMLNLKWYTTLSDGGLIPILLAARVTFSTKEMSSLYELVTKFHFRVKTICKVSYTSILELVIQIVGGINDKQKPITTTDEIRQKMLEWSGYPNDNQFKANLENLTLKISNHAKYALIMIEYAKGPGLEKASKLIRDDIQLEHIMPKSLSEDWKKEINKWKPGITDIDSFHRENLHKIGNLTLLSPSSNNTMKNSLFSKKKNGDGGYGGYLHDDNIITKEIKDDKWTDVEIAKRQKQFEEKALEIWKI